MKLYNTICAIFVYLFAISIFASGYEKAPPTLMNNLKCFENISGHSTYRYTPMHISPNIPPDITYHYGGIVNELMVLPDPNFKGVWHIYGSHTAQSIDIREIKNGYVVLNIGTKGLIIKHGYKVSTSKEYPLSYNLEFEEFDSIDPIHQFPKKIELPRNTPIYSISESKDDNSMTIFYTELIRRLNGVEKNFFSKEWQEDGIQGYTPQMYYDKYLKEALLSCKDVENTQVKQILKSIRKKLETYLIDIE